MRAAASGSGWGREGLWLKCSRPGGEDRPASVHFLYAQLSICWGAMSKLLGIYSGVTRVLSQSITLAVFWDKNLSQINHSTLIWDKNLLFSSILLEILSYYYIFYHTFMDFWLFGIKIYPRFSSNWSSVINHMFLPQVFQISQVSQGCRLTAVRLVLALDFNGLASLQVGSVVVAALGIKGVIGVYGVSGVYQGHWDSLRALGRPGLQNPARLKCIRPRLQNPAGSQVNSAGAKNPARHKCIRPWFKSSPEGKGLCLKCSLPGRRCSGLGQLRRRETRGWYWSAPGL